jgi:predicted nuclease with TOPRIM domain
MSDAMLHGVLRMPPDCWRDDPIDQQQRYSRYVQASGRIERQDEALVTLKTENERLKQVLAEREARVTLLKTKLHELPSHFPVMIRKLWSPGEVQAWLVRSVVIEEDEDWVD